MFQQISIWNWCTFCPVQRKNYQHHQIFSMTTVAAMTCHIRVDEKWIRWSYPTVLIIIYCGHAYLISFTAHIVHEISCNFSIEAKLFVCLFVFVFGHDSQFGLRKNISKLLRQISLSNFFANISLCILWWHIKATESIVKPIQNLQFH